MKSTTTCRSRNAIRFIAVLGAMLVTSSLQAWPWKAEPQPLIEVRSAIWSDADSPLAWDSSKRILWHLSGGQLAGAFWSSGTFFQSSTGFFPKREVGLLADPALHFLYFADTAGIPHVFRGRGKFWEAEKIGDTPITRLLAVDSRKHSLFAYDAVARGIRLYTYDLKTKAWTSELIAAGLGAAEEAGAFDPLGRVLYSTHETVDSTLSRHGLARSVPDPTGIGAWKPWPLVATTWSGAGWTSRVLDETGVPQQPAVRLADRRLFYAQHDEPDLIHFYQPARNRKPEAFGSVAGWSGSDTYVDHHYYELRKPTYPSSWYSSGFTMRWAGVDSRDFVLRFFLLPLQGPITVVPYYEPIWTDTALPPRLVRFRAVVNARQSRLVQHRLLAEGESVRKQTGQRLAGYLYRDANGVLATSGSARSSSLAPAQVYPVLGPNFDPANPPANFQDLASSSAVFSAYKRDTTLVSKEDLTLLVGGPSIAPNFSTDPNAPWVEAYLRSPVEVRSRTFGHQYASKLLDQVGGRYRLFSGASTSLAAASQLAADAATGFTFYTQATEPRSESPAANSFFNGYSATPLAGFAREVEQKFVPLAERVWIVTVY